MGFELHLGKDCLGIGKAIKASKHPPKQTQGNT